MTKLTAVAAKASKSGKRGARKGKNNFLGEDLQDRFGPLLLGFNEAHHDLLEAKGPTSIRLTNELDIYEIAIEGVTSTSKLTAVVISDGGSNRLEPIDFQTSFCPPLFPDFSYNRDCKDAYIKRLMTCWLEKSFLTHEAAILDGIRALPQEQNVADA